MNNLTPLSKARATLVLDHPFFATLLLRMETVPSGRVETMATDGKTILYNPEWIKALPHSQLVGVLAHEAMHAALRHMTRRGERSPEKWNIAADYAVNPILQDAGMELPASALSNSAYAGMSAEAIYAALPDHPQQGGQNQQAGQAGGSGGSASSSAGTGAQQGNGNNRDETPDPNQADGGAGGGGQAGHDGDGQEPVPDPGGCGAVMDARDRDGNRLSEAEQSQLEQEWDTALAQAAQAAKAMGKLPGAAARLVQEILNPKLDWRVILQRFVADNIPLDTTWRYPDRRFAATGLYLPSDDGEQYNIAVVIDTSSSITQTELDQFAAEFGDILSQHQVAADLIYCDAKVQKTEEVTSADVPLRLVPAGGGGTDFRPPFEWLEEQGKRPHCLVYLTDLECSRYPEDPGYPVLWVSTQKVENWNRPPFGEVVEL